MVAKTPTPILIDTAILSQIVTDVLAIAGAPSTKKSACLNKVAARIAGKKFNWGFLTGRELPVIAQGVKGLDIVAADTTPEIDPMPASETDVVSIVRDALGAKMPITLLLGAPGDGKFSAALRASLESGLQVSEKRLDPLSEIDLQRTPGAAPRLPDKMRPAAGKTVTIYSDFDQMNDAVLVALNAELLAFCQARQEGHVVLTSSDPERLMPRLRRLAPELLNRALKVTTSQPVSGDILSALESPMFKEFMQTSAKAIGDMAMKPAPHSLPSLEGWKRAGKIMQAAKTGRGALVEAEFIARSPDAPAPFDYPEVSKVSAQDLIDFMSSEPKFSARVTRFMRAHLDDVQSAIDTGQITPKTWQVIARLAQLLDEAIDQGSEDRQLRHVRLLRIFATEHLGRHSKAFLAAMEV
jgi:hypothetical protein